MIPSPRVSRRLALAVAWILCGLYAYAALDRGWVPHDEGQFGQTAERTLQGEIPHRDFDEMYTGGLTYVHAAAFRWLGENNGSFRLVLLVHFVLTLPVVFYLASRWFPPLGAAGLTALTTVWTLPNYPAPVPSWHNLFLAVIGIGATVRFLETGRRGWLFGAGLCGGLSFLVKLVGLYYVAGVALFLLFHEQVRSASAVRANQAGQHWYGVAVGIAAALPIAGLLFTMASAGLGGGAFTFALLPGVAVTILVVWREVRGRHADVGTRFARHLGLLGPFLAGVLLPIGAYAMWFWLHDGLGDLLRGVFVAPQKRLANAAYPLPPLVSLLMAPGGILIVTMFLERQLWATARMRRALWGLLAVWLALAVVSDGLYRAVWLSVIQFLPLSVIAAVCAVGLSRSREASAPVQQVMLVACVTAFCTLTVVPYSAPIYFCYVTPLMALSLAGAAWLRQDRARPLAMQLLVFFLAVGTLLVNGLVPPTAREASLVGLNSRLAAPRANGIRVHAEDAAVYDTVLSLVKTHRQDGSIYAFPDSPEIYYLAEVPNPGRTIYEFLADPPVTGEQHLENATRPDVHVLVINTRPGYSGSPPPDLIARLSEHFPLGEQVGKFLVRWRR